MGRRQLLVATPVVLAGTLARVGGDPGTGTTRGRAGGLPAPRPDQRYAPPFPASVPPGRGNIVRARQVIISGPNEGLFEYIGNPALGNSPILWAVAPGTTKDPAGNTLEVSGGLAVARRAGNTPQEAIWLDANTGSLKLGAGFDNGNNYSMGIVTVGNSTPYLMSLLSPTDRPAAVAHSMSVQLALQTGGVSQSVDPGSIVMNNGGTGYTRVSQAVLELGSANAAVITQMLAIAAFGDTAVRFAVDVTGRHTWGPGNAAVDVELYRAGAGILQTDHQFRVNAASAGIAAYTLGVTGDTNERLIVDSNGKLSWSSGAAASDTDLYRLLAGFLATDSVYALGNQAAGSPASQVGFSLIYSDSFTQLHTDRAFQSDISVEIKNHVAPGAGGSGAKSWSASGHRQITSAQTGAGGDTLTYDVERLTMDLPADTAVLSNTAATNIPGLATKTVQAQKYKIRVFLGINAGAAAGVITVNIAGPALTSGGLISHAIDNSNVNNVAQGTPGSINYTQTNAGRTTEVVLEGVVTFSAAGSLSVQTRTSLAADTYTVKAGSYWELSPVVAS